MTHSHSWRSPWKPPRIDVEFPTPTGSSFGYDGRDLEELDRLIAAKVTTPRAVLEQARATGRRR